MKLERPLTQHQTERVQTTHDHLKKSYADFKAKDSTWRAAQQTMEKLQAEYDGIRSSCQTTAKAAEAINTLGTQIKLAARGVQTAEREREDARATVIGAIRSAANLIRETCGPLVDQFKRDLANALRPFSMEPERGAQTLIGNFSDGHNALTGFLQRGLYISRDAGLDEIFLFKLQLGTTLENMLDGGDIWSLRPEDEPEEAAAA